MKPSSDTDVGPAWPRLWCWAGGAVFVIVALASAAGYRYGSSDQAFHVPAVIHALDPEAFPRDGVLLDAQARLMLTDEVIAAVVRGTGLPIASVFFAVTVVSLWLFWLGLVRVGLAAYGDRWLTAALTAAATLRHRIPETSANSFEPYYNPRMLAFALGVIAMGAVQRRQPWLAIGLVALGALVHVTTALWFAVFLGVAIVVLQPAFRRLAVPVAGLAVCAAAGMVILGPLQSSLTRMDDLWLQAIASKDSLFPQVWPAWAWAANLGLLPLAWALHRWRLRRGLASRDETAFLWGGAALVSLFVVTLPLVGARMALPTQLQISRVFWILDLLATVQLVGALGALPRRPVVAAVVAVLAMARAGYVMAIEHPERPLVAVRLPEDEWHEAMRFLAEQPRSAHVLADPGHAWKYGTSVRVASGHDVVLEEVKDAALAIYDRDVARRVLTRMRDLDDFASLDAERARDLGARYDADFLVTDTDLPLPLAHRNRRFRVYRLERDSTPPVVPAAGSPGPGADTPE